MCRNTEEMGCPSSSSVPCSDIFLLYDELHVCPFIHKEKLVLCLQCGRDILLAFRWHFLSRGLVVLNKRGVLMCVCVCVCVCMCVCAWLADQLWKQWRPHRKGLIRVSRTELLISLQSIMCIFFTKQLSSLLFSLRLWWCILLVLSKPA